MISHTENTERNIIRIKIIKVTFFLTALRQLDVGNEKRSSYSIEDSIYLTRSWLNWFLHLWDNALSKKKNCDLSLTAGTVSIKLPSCLPASRTQQWWGKEYFSAFSAWKVCLEGRAHGLDWQILKMILWPGDLLQETDSENWW